MSDGETYWTEGSGEHQLIFTDIVAKNVEVHITCDVQYDVMVTTTVEERWGGYTRTETDADIEDLTLCSTDTTFVEVFVVTQRDGKKVLTELVNAPEWNAKAWIDWANALTLEQRIDAMQDKELEYEGGAVYL